jgi:hypothetical protein
LRSWRPRRPSPGIENRLFGAHAAAAGTVATTADFAETPVFHTRWLAPALASLVLFCAVFNQRNFGTLPDSSGSASNLSMAMILSNRSAAAYLPAASFQQHNRPMADTFEWTNGESSTSSIRSLSLPRGNY